MANLSDYLRMFDKLHVNKTRDGTSPHKPCLLLAVIDLVESGAMSDRRVQYTPGLRELFSEYFAVVAKPNDRETPYNPFFYMKSEPFWTITPKEGREAALEALTAPSNRQIDDNVKYAEIDTELFKYMRSSEDRDALRDRLISRWFPSHRARLNTMLSFRRESNGYERSLRGFFEETPMVRDAPFQAAVRNSAFRRLVLEAYDYRCAASGWRLIVPADRSPASRILVEAAHLIPHKETQDDDPRNGIALTPNFHWALDRHVIAPGPDLKWHVSEVIEERIADNHPLIDLKGKNVLVPNKREMQPRRDALEWRLEHLIKVEK